MSTSSTLTTERRPALAVVPALPALPTEAREDRDGDGAVTARELMACAEEWLARQHPALRGGPACGRCERTPDLDGVCDCGHAAPGARLISELLGQPPRCVPTASGATGAGETHHRRPRLVVLNRPHRTPRTR